MHDLSGESISRYHIIEQIDEGGMAVIYKAYDYRLERKVAIKVIRMDEIPPARLEKVIHRFEQEAKKTAQLQHPNIIPVIDYGTYENAPYLVMPFIEGGNLKDLQKSNKSMNYVKAARLLAPIARALEYAHGRKIAHRDIKPSNILITENGQPMLTDFGIAKIFEKDKLTSHGWTEEGMAIGTPEYMSKGQWLCQEIDGRTDIYSLGVVFFELITGQVPFRAETYPLVMNMMLNDPLKNPREFVPDLPEEVEQILLKALARDRENRYEDMGQFADALEKIQKEGGKGKYYPTNKEYIVLERQNAQKKTYESIEEKLKKGNSVHDVSKNKKGCIRKYVVSGIILILLIGGVWVGWKSYAAFPETAPIPTSTVSIEVMVPKTSIPPTQYISATVFVPTPTIQSTPTEIYSIGSSQISEKDGMKLLYVPAGNFEMGSTEEQYQALFTKCTHLGSDSSFCQQLFGDEIPIHQVYLDAFWIDETEVTNAMYEKCVDLGGCTVPEPPHGSHSRNSYYGNKSFADYPVILVDWIQAEMYCKWASRTLPTEAQWEKAARGPFGRIYPWGEELDRKKANYHTNDTSKVGSYPSDISPYGALDMAGNVYEMVSDWYSSEYYQESPNHNPTGPDSGEYRVFRSGTWADSDGDGLRTSSRGWNKENIGNLYTGFRCSISQNSLIPE